MKKTILEIYALAVCFVSIICFVVCLGVAGYSLVQIAKPDFTMRSYDFDNYQSNDTYWKMKEGRGSCSKEDKSTIRPSESELTKQRTEAFSLEKASEQRDGEQTLVKTLIVILVDALAFLIHWRIARSARS
ncbi:MAG: hypothetical protein PHI11_00385 [Gallionella sp.]|nr:hypothetical protein [Gallionella sp.]